MIHSKLNCNSFLDHEEASSQQYTLHDFVNIEILLFQYKKKEGYYPLFAKPITLPINSKSDSAAAGE